MTHAEVSNQALDSTPLWYACSCPYAQRAWIALEELNVPYTTHLIDATNKDPAFKELYASIVQDPDMPAKVPTIIGPPIHTSVPHAQSSIMEHWRYIGLLLLFGCIAGDLHRSTDCIVHADGEDKLTESLVVVEYLDQKYGKDTPLLPRDPLQHAKVPRHDLEGRVNVRPFGVCSHG